ncbi:MAG: phosphoribosylanthranilate isomerase, partial [Candidatus Binatia bacterium]
VKVKVCGITNTADAVKAVEFGADALGFNFYPPSARYIAPERARKILLELPRSLCKAALFVNEPREVVRKVIEICSRADGEPLFTALQFHGDESPDDCRDWDFKVIKAFRIRDESSVKKIDVFPADFYLLDSWNPGYGGSGEAFSWDWARRLKTDRLILAGGLGFENVTEAIRTIHPYGVDVCTGVEATPGIKDHEKLKRFIETAKAA